MEVDGIEFAVVSADQIPKILVRNIDWIHSCRDLKFSPGVTAEILREMESVLFKTIQVKSTPINEICLQNDIEMALKLGTSMWVVKHLISIRAWSVDLFVEFDVTKPLVITRSNVCKIIINQIKQMVDHDRK